MWQRGEKTPPPLRLKGDVTDSCVWMAITPDTTLLGGKHPDTQHQTEDKIVTTNITLKLHLSTDGNLPRTDCIQISLGFFFFTLLLWLLLRRRKGSAVRGSREFSTAKRWRHA